MATNKILPWAQTGTANVLSDDAYAADVATGGLYGDGVKNGQASSKQANKTWRQATAPGSGLGQFLVDNLSVDVTDADTPATFSSRIANAILKLAQISPFNQSFAAAIGGYRKYAIVSDSSGNFWVSTADQNVTVPGVSGAKWQSLFNGLVTGTAGGTNKAVTNLQMVNATSGDSSRTYMQVTTPSVAIAVPTMTYMETKLGLMTPQGWASHQVQTPTAGTAFWIESDATFNASGQLFMFVSANMGQSGIQQPSQCYLRIYLDDNILTSEYTTNAMSLSWVSSVAAGAHTIKALYLPNAGNYSYISTGLTLSWLFVPNPT